ncbi:YeiH family protein [Paenibacillus radicis (ex Gao et al. 2016)]|uniref:Membrane protein n=1 Tax=Paenibacillus radicis (ex Gao et al. 2016) TaxID=1737354 RepID=A0A917HBH3_9BACL|nr:putative sulfate exporter family transporter [Paenibacillus radicis (ex Gao et al. 2016)]GGG73546.1 membrane protein [Paenibacillus radicis (ex Gao et al. 2016)]
MRTLSDNTLPYRHNKQDRHHGDMLHLKEWLGGLAFTIFLAAAAYGLALLPGFNRLGQMALAISGAVLYRQLFGYPEQWRKGIQLASKQLLRFAIILFGLRLNIGTVLQQGWGLLLQAAVVAVFAIGLTIWLARRLKADFSLSLLLGVGTGICGAAAIAAVSPILKSRDSDTAIGAGLIALIGTITALGYTLLQPLLPLSAEQYGAWAGISLHEIAHVALAAQPAGEDAVVMGLLAKLARVFMLIPLSFAFILIMKRRSKGKDEAAAKIAFPWFLLGFMAMSAFGTFSAHTAFAIPDSALKFLAQAATFLLAMAMVGLGLNVDLKAVRAKALRPLAAVTITSVLLSAGTLLVHLFSN